MRFSYGLAALALLATATAKDDAVPDVKDVVVDAISEGQEQQTEEESLVASTVKAADDATVRPPPLRRPLPPPWSC